MLTLAALLLHARRYLFLTDDAFISFRYARNLSHGHGLVFNPGHEAVEGYSNFLWTVLLATFDRLGVAPERMAIGLSLALTVGLWALVVWFGRRLFREDGGPEWVLVATALLAITRSIAVWASSGLETRAFEFLLVAGALRLVVEIEAQVARDEPRRSVAVWLFALATLTRPDGLLLSISAFVAAAVVLARNHRLVPKRFLVHLLPFLALVGGHFLFRRLYYGDWLPNTYYVKIGGRTWWSAGVRYLGAFTLEYAAYLWIPFLVASVLAHRRRPSLVPLLFAALVLPHALYTAAIGGDHFEYRPLDLYFPFAFLLIADGARALWRSPRWRPAVVGGLALVALGLWQLPSQSHRQFPPVYMPGFPGDQLERAEGLSFLNPARDPIYRWPGLRALAETHRRWLRALSGHFIGLRQEEHRLFLATVKPEGEQLHDLVRRGLLPPDVYIAIACVGAIPYYSGLPTLDRLGLTDAHVAHSEFIPQRAMAHDKVASFDYAVSRGVDLWSAHGVNTLCHVTSTPMLAVVSGEAEDPKQFPAPPFAADVGDGNYLLAVLPQGLDHARERMPKLSFRPIGDPSFMEEFLTRGIAAYRDSLMHHPNDQLKQQGLADLLLMHDDFAEARAMYRDMTKVTPDDIATWQLLAVAEEHLGDPAAARTALERAIRLAKEQDQIRRADELSQELQRLMQASGTEKASRH